MDRVEEDAVTSEEKPVEVFALFGEFISNRRSYREKSSRKPFTLRRKFVEWRISVGCVVGAWMTTDWVGADLSEDLAESAVCPSLFPDLLSELN